jgi:hypothetical protein
VRNFNITYIYCCIVSPLYTLRRSLSPNHSMGPLPGDHSAPQPNTSDLGLPARTNELAVKGTRVQGCHLRTSGIKVYDLHGLQRLTKPAMNYDLRCSAPADRVWACSLKSQARLLVACKDAIMPGLHSIQRDLVPKQSNMTSALSSGTRAKTDEEQSHTSSPFAPGSRRLFMTQARKSIINESSCACPLSH